MFYVLRTLTKQGSWQEYILADAFNVVIRVNPVQYRMWTLDRSKVRGSKMWSRLSNCLFKLARILFLSTEKLDKKH